ncbi:hypothetical protein [Actinosynnema sp. NPDC020468]|uniref:hypothetical protein n=1 Tax=Actinosynnema sp. NPDC020468 TaxID=3154488 RepID=UPI0033E5E6AF
MMTIDVNDLTVGEIETIEDLIDASIDSVGEKGARKGRFLRAVAYVVQRRDNAEFTWEDAAHVRMAVSTSDAEGNGEAPAPNRAARRAQSRKPD